MFHPLAKPEPGHNLKLGQVKLQRRITDEVDDRIAHIVLNPPTDQVTLSFFFVSASRAPSFVHQPTA